MRIVRLIPLLCGLLGFPISLWAAPPVLAKLEYSAGILGGLFPNRASIAAVEGAQPSPYAGKPRAAWVLRAGDTIKQPTMPPERFIRFYRMNGNEGETVCTVIVKYVADSNGWRPSYQMLQQPILAHDGYRPVPVPGADSARGMMQLQDTQQPDRDGFYSELMFGYANEPTVIDAWEVQ